MTAEAKQLCSICGLLCPLVFPGDNSRDPADFAGQLPHLPSVQSCAGRNQWLQRRAHAAGATDCFSQASDIAEVFEDRFRALLSRSKRPLIWLDSADVQTTRAAVRLAKAWNATVHVHKSIGSRLVAEVTCADGWLSTTLADAAAHSQLLVTLGSRWQHNMPLLQSRFFSADSNCKRWSILSQPEASGQPEQSQANILVWPRQSWYERLCQLSLDSTQPSAIEQDTLAGDLVRSAYTTILWDVDDLTDNDNPQQDQRPLVQQLLQLAKLNNEHRRCCLLALDAETGGLTADAVLLWLTGCTSTAKPIDVGWISPEHYRFYQHSEWRAEFDAILLVRSVATLRDLPDLKADITLCQVTDADLKRESSDCFFVGTAGVDHPAMLMRGDHGMFGYVNSPGQKSLTSLPAAWSLLERAIHCAKQFCRGER